MRSLEAGPRVSNSRSFSRERSINAAPSLIKRVYTKRSVRHPSRTNVLRMPSYIAPNATNPNRISSVFTDSKNIFKTQVDITPKPMTITEKLTKSQNERHSHRRRPNRPYHNRGEHFHQKTASQANESTPNPIHIEKKTVIAVPKIEPISYAYPVNSRGEITNSQQNYKKIEIEQRNNIVANQAADRMKPGKNDIAQKTKIAAMPVNETKPSSAIAIKSITDQETRATTPSTVRVNHLILPNQIMLKGYVSAPRVAIVPKLKSLVSYEQIRQHVRLKKDEDEENESEKKPESDNKERRVENMKRATEILILAISIFEKRKLKAQTPLRREPKTVKYVVDTTTNDRRLLEINKARNLVVQRSKELGMEPNWADVINLLPQKPKHELISELVRGFKDTDGSYTESTEVIRRMGVIYPKAKVEPILNAIPAVKASEHSSHQVSRADVNRVWGENLYDQAA